VEDDQVAAAVRLLVRRDDPGTELLAWQDSSGWHDVTSADVGVAVKERLGADATPKDFRTWHATVLAAVALAIAPVANSERARNRTIAAAVADVAERLGNTPAVCRSSYVDPRIFDCYLEGHTISSRMHSLAEAEAASPAQRRRIELEVLALLDD